MAAEVLSASDLNAEFNNILNNPVALWSPAAAAVDFDGQTLTLDAAAATTVVSSAAVSWNFTSGAKTGTPSTSGSVERFSAQTFTDNATAGSGTATAAVFYSIATPTLAATNTLVTTTDAATWYIAGQPTAGTNETITNAWALWIDAGNVRFDDDIYWRSGTAFNGIFAHNISAARTWTFPDATGTVPMIVSGVLDISGASQGQIQFPAAQNSSTGANVLDDYEEGTWTPSLTAATVGNLSVAYSSQVGTYCKIARFLQFTGTIQTSSFTHTTASGDARIQNAPFTSEITSGIINAGSLTYQGITKAGFTDFTMILSANTTIMNVAAMASGSAVATLAITEMPSGGTVVLRFCFAIQASA